jgi:probable H4MPT-linked C1 transfer pathway protein
MTSIIGWDIGGAHLKAALWRDGRIEAVRQVPCTLWLGVRHLEDDWRAVAADLGPADSHAVTMTGELAEVFASREEGVRAICRTVAGLAGRTPARFYAGPHGFLPEAEAVRAWRSAASANWHASARWAGGNWPEALFLDIGSTTTDIIPIAAGVPVARGFTDAERLEAGELVYTGVVRTSLMALADRVPFAGKWQGVMAENFATTADIYRLTGELAAEDDSYPATDGRTKSAPDCRARIARMLGRDVGEADEAAWLQVARFFRERQMRLIEDAAAQALSVGTLGADAPYIAIGAGRAIVHTLAKRAGRASVSCGKRIPAVDEAVRRRAEICLPAAAVAMLAAQS